MCRCEREISAVLTERCWRTRDVPNSGHGGHGGHGRHGRYGASRGPGTRRVTSPITELTTPITAVTAPVTVVTAPDTADTAPARRADVGMPVRGRLRVQHRRFRASEAATLAGLARGGGVPVGAGNSCGVSRRGGSFHHPIQGLAGRKILTQVKQRYLAGCKRGRERREGWTTYTRVYKVPNASNVSRKRPGAQICIYARTDSA